MQEFKAIKKKTALDWIQEQELQQDKKKHKERRSMRQNRRVDVWSME